MMHATTFFKGIGIGAGMMYFWDPEQGRRRRKLLQSQVQGTFNNIGEAADKTWRDLTNRAYGSVVELRSTVGSHDNSDRVVEQRIRSKLGRYVSHPSAIEVEVTDGCVTLSGPILANEVEQFVSCVKSVRGVKSVENSLDVHASPGNISALQGGRERTGEKAALLQDNWSPATRLMVGSVAGVCLLSCARAFYPLSLIAGIAGLGALASSQLRNQPAVPSRNRHEQSEQTEEETADTAGEFI